MPKNKTLWLLWNKVDISNTKEIDGNSAKVSAVSNVWILFALWTEPTYPSNSLEWHHSKVHKLHSFNSA